MAVYLRPIQSYYQSNLTAVCGVLCAATATEMALRSIRHYLNYSKDANDQAKYDFGYSLSGNLGGAVFLGICATNHIPATARLGALGFWIYSSQYWRDPAQYWVGKLITFQLAIDWVLDPAWRGIKRTATFIWDVVSAVLALIPIPKHPIWIGVVVLGLVSIATQGIRNDWLGVASRCSSFLSNYILP